MTGQPATPTPAAPSAPAAPVVGARAANVVLTSPAHPHGGYAAAAARRYGSPQSGGYQPVAGQTYTDQGGAVLTVHSDGSGTLTDSAGNDTQLSPCLLYTSDAADE